MAYDHSYINVPAVGMEQKQREGRLVVETCCLHFVECSCDPLSVLFSTFFCFLNVFYLFFFFPRFSNNK